MGSRIRIGFFDLDLRVSPSVPVGAWPEGLRAILPKRLLPTRLETRTKESTRHASVLAEKPTRVMKVIDAKRKQQHRPTMIL
jgi:hypothetical protein